jgi:hypothetical protein
MRLREHVDNVATLRRSIREADESTSDWELRNLWDEAQSELAKVRLFGDLVVAAFFENRNPKERETKRAEYARAVVSGEAERYRAWVEKWRQVEQSLAPLHWEIEFPEVFERQDSGFDGVIGNPPFLGGTLIGGRLGLTYHDYLVTAYPPATGLADLIAFFLRRSFGLLRGSGGFGLIATNTVSQGDTRVAGLETILREGGQIYEAQRRYQWPGDAAVIVSVVHLARTMRDVHPILDGLRVERISSFLRRGNVDAMPATLSQNRGICYMGTKIWGAGFVFEEDPSNGSSSLAEMERLVSQDPRNGQVIFRYLGGQEFNTSPVQAPSRFVIDFGELSEAEARGWPSLFSILEERVRPVRAKNKQRNYRENWWLHANRVLDSPAYLEQHGRLLALTSVSRHISAAFVERGTIVSDSMVVFLLHEDADFAVIQSRVHELWARFIGSSMKDDLRYTTPCFDTFPRPTDARATRLGAVGSAYYRIRAQVMETNREGLTKTYNRFHDPDEHGPQFENLRELHEAMDRTVLDAYGWGDILTNCEFLLDYEIDEEDWRDKKKPYRYRWPDEVRDEVLTRLLELNAERAKEEARSGGAATKKRRKSTARKRAPNEPDTEDLFS